VHVLEDVGNTELPALAGGDVLRTVKIVNQEVRLASKVAKAGMDRLASALTSVFLLLLQLCACDSTVCIAFGVLVLCYTGTSAECCSHVTVTAVCVHCQWHLAAS